MFQPCVSLIYAYGKPTHNIFLVVNIIGMLIQEMLFNYSIAFKSQMHRETQVSLDIQTRPNLKTLSVLNYESERSPVFFLKKRK